MTERKPSNPSLFGAILATVAVAGMLGALAPQWLKSSDRPDSDPASSATPTAPCTRESHVFSPKLTASAFNLNAREVRRDRPHCYQFELAAGDRVRVTTSTKAVLWLPGNRQQTIMGTAEIEADAGGLYQLVVATARPRLGYQLELSATGRSPARHADKAQLPELPPNFIYNVRQPPPLRSNPALEKIVAEIVEIARDRNLPTEDLSISLVALSPEPSCCADADFQGQIPRYPASIVKLFWVVALYAQADAGLLPEDSLQADRVEKTLALSDNDTASEILDAISRTQSSQTPLAKAKFEDWSRKRHGVSDFFTRAGYRSLNIAQKTFPIPQLALDRPEGPDRQLREIDGQERSPRRNVLTTASTARLLFELDRGLAISPERSQQIAAFLRHDLDPQAWQNEPRNAIAGFLGQGLPPETEFYSKIGWTSQTRNDAAIVVPANGKQRYILVVFGDNAKYYEDELFFPLLSHHVYRRLTL